MGFAKRSGVPTTGAGQMWSCAGSSGVVQREPRKQLGNYRPEQACAGQAFWNVLCATGAAAIVPYRTDAESASRGETRAAVLGEGEEVFPRLEVHERHQ